MMAAGTAAGRGLKVLLAEPNPKLGKKLRITGKGRCNVTNNCSVREFMASGRYIPLRQLISDESFFAHPSEITYPIAGAFVAFLIEKLGPQRFLHEVYRSDVPLLENLCRCLDIEENQVEAAFQAAVLAGETA